MPSSQSIWTAASLGCGSRKRWERKRRRQQKGKEWGGAVKAEGQGICHEGSEEVEKVNWFNARKECSGMDKRETKRKDKRCPSGKCLQKTSSRRSTYCRRLGAKRYFQLNTDLLWSPIYQGLIKLWCQCSEKRSCILPSCLKCFTSLCPLACGNEFVNAQSVDSCESKTKAAGSCLESVAVIIESGTRISEKEPVYLLFRLISLCYISSTGLWQREET